MATGAAQILQVSPNCDVNDDVFIVMFPKTCSLKKKQEDAVLALHYITCTLRALSEWTTLLARLYFLWVGIVFGVVQSTAKVQLQKKKKKK